jgi:hypothetical protein
MEMKPLDYPGRNSIGMKMKARIETDAQYSWKRHVSIKVVVLKFHLRKG